MMRIKCNICKKKFTGYGNDAAPVEYKGLCCDKCNWEVVMPARLKLIGIDDAFKYIKEVQEENNK